MAVGSKKRVLISGAGVAGMTTAILLDKEKYDVEIIEQADRFRNIGFSILLWKTGFYHLLSLLEENSEHITEGKDYFRLDGFKVFSGTPPRLLQEFAASGYGWAFERKRLMEILEGVLEKHVRNKTNFSRAIRHIEYPREHTRALVTFRDGSKDAYDLVIIAEGIHSTSRELIAVREQVDSVPYALRYAWFSSETSLGDYGGLFFAEGRIAVIHPPHSKNLLGFYFDKGSPLDMQIEFENNVCALIKQPDGGNSTLDIKTSDIFELKEVHLDRYFAKNVVLVGDAAHGRPPTLGFGTSLALEDAVCLTQKLNALSEPTEESMQSALESYSAKRMRRVEEVYRFQNKIQKFYTRSHLKVILLSFLVKTFLGPLVEYRIKKLASYTE